MLPINTTTRQVNCVLVLQLFVGVPRFIFLTCLTLPMFYLQIIVNLCVCVRARVRACVRVCVCVRVRVCVLGNCTLLLYILRHNTFNLLLVIVILMSFDIQITCQPICIVSSYTCSSKSIKPFYLYTVSWKYYLQTP